MLRQRIQSKIRCEQSKTLQVYAFYWLEAVKCPKSSCTFINRAQELSRGCSCPRRTSCAEVREQSCGKRGWTGEGRREGEGKGKGKGRGKGRGREGECRSPSSPQPAAGCRGCGSPVPFRPLAARAASAASRSRQSPCEPRCRSVPVARGCERCSPLAVNPVSAPAPHGRDALHGAGSSAERGLCFNEEDLHLGSFFHVSGCMDKSAAHHAGQK